MRGRSGAYLVEGSDGRFYVAKFKGNPKGTRTLINELLGSAIFRSRALPAAEGVVLKLSEEALCGSDWPLVGTGGDRHKAEAGLHFGSAVPGNPDKNSIYDFIPSKLNYMVVNRDSFHMALILDVVLGRSERRQCVFTRNADRKLNPYFIDNSMLFGGSDWAFGAIAEQSSYIDVDIYSGSFDSSVYVEACSSIIELVAAMRTELLGQIPSEWIEGNENELHLLLDCLCHRILSLQTDRPWDGIQFETDESLMMLLGRLNLWASIHNLTGPSTNVALSRKPVHAERLAGGAKRYSANLSANAARGVAS